MSKTRSSLFAGVMSCVLAWGCAAEDPIRTARGSSSNNTRPSTTSPSAIGTAIPAPGAAGSSGLATIAPGGSNTASGGNGKVCASAIVQTAKNTPTVVFVIDGSGSMCAPFGGGVSRWQALRSALLDPMRGLIYRVENQVKFGATLYDGTIDLALALLAGAGAGGPAQNPPCALQSGMGKEMGMCPLLIDVPAKQTNAMAIDMAYPQRELGGSTPTDKAMNHVMDALLATVKQQGPDQAAQSPMYVILATDGAPNDICLGGIGGDGAPQRQGVIAAVDRGAAAGITTWVISLAGNDAALQAHLDEVAKHGAPKNPAARTFSPTNPDDLIMTLAQLLGGAIGCHITLNGKVTVGQECMGKVEQNAVELPCCQSTGPNAWNCARQPTAQPNGWRLTNANSIELVGDACAKFLLGAGNVLSATFPCTVFTPD